MQWADLQRIIAEEVSAALARGGSRFARAVTRDLADYHVPVNADIDSIEVIFVAEPDPEVTPLGVKGLGEIGIVGTAAAVANAIFHATGKRVRSLPVTIDRLL